MSFRDANANANASFFQRPATGLCDVYSHSFRIFWNEWKTFVLIASIQLLCLSVVGFVMVAILYLLFASDAMGLMALVGMMYATRHSNTGGGVGGGGGGHGRGLILSSISPLLILLLLHQPQTQLQTQLQAQTLTQTQMQAPPLFSSRMLMTTTTTIRGLFDPHNDEPHEELNDDNEIEEDDDDDMFNGVEMGIPTDDGFMDFFGSESNDDDLFKGGPFNPNAALANMEGKVLQFVFVYVLLLMGMTFLLSFFQGATISVAAEVIAGRRRGRRQPPPRQQQQTQPQQSTAATTTTCSSLWSSFGIAWRYLCPLFGYNFAVSMLTVVGTWIIFGMFFLLFKMIGDAMSSHPLAFMILYVVVLTSFVSIVVSSTIAGRSSILVERIASIPSALGGSWRLSRGNLCRIFCCLFCFELVSILVTTILTAIVRAFLSNSSSAFMMTLLLQELILTLIVGPLVLIMEVVLYFSLRIEKDGLTQSMLIEELGVSFARTTTAASLEMGSVRYAVANVIPPEEDEGGDEEDHDEKEILDVTKKSGGYRDIV